MLKSSYDEKLTATLSLIDSDKLNRIKQKGYAIGNILLAFISEFDVTERQSITAYFYNKLAKKDQEFKRKSQEYELKYKAAQNKKKPLPKKSQGLINHETGLALASKTWIQVLNEPDKLNENISISGVFSRFWHKERETLELLYGFKNEEFKLFSIASKNSHSFQSLKIVNLLLMRLDKKL